MPVKNRIQLRRGTTQQWGETIDVLKEGEIGFDSDVYNVKIGDGKKTWANLPWLVDISGQIVSVTGEFDVLKFNTNPGVIPAEGQAVWDSTYGTLSIGLAGDHVLNLGQETHFRIRNETGDTLYKGQAVYATGVHDDNIRIEADKYISDGTIREVRFIGLVSEDVTDNGSGFTTNFGYVRGNTISVLDTRGNGSVNGAQNLYTADEPAWAQGDILYVHPTVPGKLTKIEPKHSISIALVVRVHQEQGVLLVRPTSYGHLDDNHDVSTSGVQNNQYLIYNTGSGMWFPTSSGIFNNVYASGNVGIGILAPSGKLHVETTGVNVMVGPYNTWTNGGKLRVYGDDTDNQSQAIKAFVSRTGVGLNICLNGTSYTIGGGGSGTNIGMYAYAANGNKNYGFYSDAGWNYFADRVGIKTLNPSGELHVVGNSYFNDTLYIHSTTSLGGSYVYNKIYADPTYDNLVIQGGDNKLILSGQGGGISMYAYSTNITIGNSYNASSANQYIRFTPANSEAMRITSDGKVGIGTTSPEAKLDVDGNVSISSTGLNGESLFNIEGTNGNLFSVVDSVDGSLLSVNDITGLPAFEVFSDHSIVAGRFNTNDFVISSGGNVGIGTATPSEKLEINGALKFTNAPKILRADALNLDVIASGLGHTGWRLRNQGNNGRTFRVSSYADNTSASFRIRDDNVGLDRFVINENGYIGIGTSTPVGRLDIRASGTNSTALTIQNSNGYNIFQYLKTDDTNLLRASFDGSNFHHYLGARLYYNIGTNGVTFDGGGGSNQSQVSVTNRAYIGLNSSSTSAPGSANIHAGSTAYATSDNTLTSITPFAFTTWAWNGSNGYSINSHGYMKQVQNSTTAGDARLSIARGSDNSELFTVNYLDGNVGIGTSLPTELLTVYGDSQYLYLQAQNNSGAAGIKFGNTAARQQMYIEGTSSDLVIDSMNGGVTESIRVGYNTGAVTINEQGSNIDFRVEGDTDQNLLFVDASSDRVGIGTTAPTSKLMILTPDNYAGQVLKLQTKAENTYSLYAEANSPAGGVVTWSWNQLNAGITYANVLVFDRGNVGIGTESPTYKLQVNGSFGATTKSFRIDHPSRPNYTLEYGSLESPYHGVRLTGRGRVVKGSGVVSLPYYLKDLIHDDETINIQITNIKHGKNIYVDEIDLNNDQFTVRVDRAKTLGTLEFFWTFTGTRKDVDKLVVEAEK